MFGIPARTGPALQPTQTPVAQTDPWQQLSWPDKAEFKEIWWPLAQEQGRTEPQARQDFMQELAHRKQLNDEPFGAN